MTREQKPWFLVEVKKADTDVSPSLGYMQKQIRAEHAFQVVIDEPYVNRNCFDIRTPVAVPARTFLSQLL